MCVCVRACVIAPVEWLCKWTWNNDGDFFSVQLYHRDVMVHPPIHPSIHLPIHPSSHPPQASRRSSNDRLSSLNKHSKQTTNLLARFQLYLTHYVTNFFAHSCIYSIYIKSGGIMPHYNNIGIMDQVYMTTWKIFHKCCYIVINQHKQCLLKTN